jgi:GTP-binding protein
VQLPPAGPPEIAFLGRSNVGKSSLINALLGQKIARISSSPGRTQALNFFEIRRQPGLPAEFMFVDLPGYGYARVPKEVTARWPGFIEPYLQTRETLTLCVVLVDVRIPPQASDKRMTEWLGYVGRDLLLVATKADRLGNMRLQQAVRKLSSEFNVAQVLPFSSSSGQGRDALWRAIREAAALGRSPQ